MTFGEWIRRRETRLQKIAYSTAKQIQHAEFPVIPVLHPMLAFERQLRKNWLSPLFSKIYYAPLLRRAAHSVGRNLVLYEDMPKIFGNLRIEIGNRVVLSGAQVWFACGHQSQKLLKIGNDSYLGYGLELFSGSEIVIGDHVLIANHVLINGYDGHPLDPIARAAGAHPDQDGYGPIRIGDYAWIGSKAIILKNVTIGRGAVVATGAVVTKDVPELTVVAGNPAKPIKTLPAPLEWREAKCSGPAAG